MKRDFKTKILILFVLSCLCISSVFLMKTIDIEYIFNSKNSKQDISKIKNPQISQTSDRIHINNNWTETKIAGICTGNGTYSEPYIIKDMVIDADFLGNGILIENSKEYFIVKNCSIYNSGNGGWGAGIKFKNVNNSQIIENYCFNNSLGIILKQSHNNSIISNTVNRSSMIGIVLNQSSYNHILANIVGNNSGVTMGAGIILLGTNNCRVFGNVIQNNNLGISFSDSYNNDISGNQVNFNSYGIASSFSNNNSISGNYVNNNLFEGIHLEQSDYNNISRNAMNNNSLYGIYLSVSDENIISKNIMNNTERGIYIWFGFLNIISENIVNNNVDGVYLYYTNYNNISKNIIRNNSENGVILNNCDYNMVLENVISENTELGIGLDLNSIYNIIAGNIITQNTDGIYMHYSDHIEIHNNTISYNLNGINIVYCSDNNISENKIYGNEYSGLYLNRTSFNHIIGNVINNNNEYGIILIESNFNTISGNTIIGNRVCITEQNCHDNIFSDNTGCDYGEGGDGGIPVEAILFTLGGVTLLILVIIQLFSKRRKKLKNE